MIWVELQISADGSRKPVSPVLPGCSHVGCEGEIALISRWWTGS